MMMMMMIYIYIYIYIYIFGLVSWHVKLLSNTTLIILFDIADYVVITIIAI